MLSCTMLRETRACCTLDPTHPTLYNTMCRAKVYDDGPEAPPP